MKETGPFLVVYTETFESILRGAFRDAGVEARRIGNKTQQARFIIELTL